MDDFIIKDGIHFVGSPCKKCGGIVRIVSSGACALCNRKRAKQHREDNPNYHRQRIQKIKEEHKDSGLYFEGDSCVRCGNCTRYVCNSNCVLCQNERNKQRRQNIKVANKDNGTSYEGDPCINCGSCIRYASSGSCILCYKKHAKQYHGKRKETNKNKGLYFEGDPCKKHESCTRYVSTGNCVLCEKEWGKQYRENNPNYLKQWRENNPEKTKSHNQNRRARKKNAEGDFTDQEWLDLCNLYGNSCLACGEEKPLEADHIIPLAKGGTNWISNIQPLCKSCNCSKGTKIIDYRTIHSQLPL